jgi:HKD family nuclease
MELITNYEGKPSLLSFLQHDLSTQRKDLRSVDIICSFIRQSGVNVLRKDFQGLARRGIRIRVITTTLMGISEPSAIKDLATNFGNIEVKVVYATKKSITFHAKGWRFHSVHTNPVDSYSHAIIGSSNMSQVALTSGVEWNVRITHPLAANNILATFDDTFAKYWNGEHSQLCIEDFNNIPFHTLEAIIRAEACKLCEKHKQDADREAETAVAEVYQESEIQSIASSDDERMVPSPSSDDIGMGVTLPPHSQPAEFSGEGNASNPDEALIEARIGSSIKREHRKWTRYFQAELASLKPSQRPKLKNTILCGAALSAATIELRDIISTARIGLSLEHYRANVLYWMRLVEFIRDKEWQLSIQKETYPNGSAARGWIVQRFYQAYCESREIIKFELPVDIFYRAAIPEAIIWTYIIEQHWEDAAQNAMGTLRTILTGAPFLSRSHDPAESVQLVEEAMAKDELEGVAMLLILARCIRGFIYGQHHGNKFEHPLLAGRTCDFSEPVRGKWKTWLQKHKQSRGAVTGAIVRSLLNTCPFLPWY